MSAVSIQVNKDGLQIHIIDDAQVSSSGTSGASPAVMYCVQVLVLASEPELSAFFSATVPLPDRLIVPVPAPFPVAFTVPAPRPTPVPVPVELQHA